MLVGFLGVPKSAKTTCAAMLYAKLKQAGIQVEFIPEVARHYIVEQRQSSGSHNVSLDTIDQFKIQDRQRSVEDLFESQSGKGAVVLTDSSTANTWIYLEDKNLVNLSAEIARYDILFLGTHVGVTSGKMDNNRIHSDDFSANAEKELGEELAKLGKFNNLYVLYGDPETRLSSALTVVLRNLVGAS